VVVVVMVADVVADGSRGGNFVTVSALVDGESD
jgi:hypothetical protein